MASTKRVAIVTGGNKGIGLAIVRSMCKKFDVDVILTSRDEGLGTAAVKQLESEGVKPLYHQLDITSSESINNLKKYLQDKYGGLDVLINNAGIAFKRASTAPDIEQATVTLATNFTGTLNISHALFPLLRPHSRVVNMSSSRQLTQCTEHIQTRLTNSSLTVPELVALMDEFVEAVRAGNHKEKGWTTTHYGVAAIGIAALTKIHARELATKKEDILVNSCCPGLVRTDMSSGHGDLSPDEGAEMPVMLALLPHDSPTGQFWKDKKILKW